MKKFLMNRTEVMATFPVENVAQAPVVTSTTAKKVEPKEDVKVPLLHLQPPLPPYPPPPDSRPVISILIKKEKPDVEETPFNELPEPMSQKPALLPDHDQTAKKPKKLMCKDFVKGFCNRPVCKFSHEIDLSQLKDMFMFCYDYQNHGCTRPHCKYIHADIFEEATFYREGILPPHSTSHHKNVLPPPPSHQLPPPPPPPPPLDKETLPQQDSTMNFPYPPPVIPPIDIGGRPVEDDLFQAATSPCSTSPLKRGWSLPENIGSAPRDLEHLAKKCKNCEIMDFRLQYYKEKLEKQILTAEEFDKDMALLDNKCTKLTTVLLALIIEQRLSENLDHLIGDNSCLSPASLTTDDSVENSQYEEVNLSDLLKLF